MEYRQQGLSDRSGLTRRLRACRREGGDHSSGDYGGYGGVFDIRHPNIPAKTSFEPVGFLFLRLNRGGWVGRVVLFSTRFLAEGDFVAAKIKTRP